MPRPLVKLRGPSSWRGTPSREEAADAGVTESWLEMRSRPKSESGEGLALSFLGARSPPESESGEVV